MTNPNRSGRSSTSVRELQGVAGVIRSGRLLEAESTCRLLLLSNPGDPEVLWMTGALCLHAGQAKYALMLAGRAVEAAPDQIRCHLLVGRAARVLGNDPEAVLAYEGAIRLDSRSVDGWIGLGLALRASDPVRAKSCLEHACELAPGSPLPFLNLANIFLDLDELERAETMLRQAIAIAPDMEEAHLNLGLLRLRRGHRDDAIAAFRRVVEIDPLSAQAAVRLGALLGLSGNRAEATHWLHEAVTKAPGDAAVHLFAGDAWRTLGKPDAAFAAYARCVALDPTSVIGLNNLSNLCRNAGRLTEAEAHARRAVSLAPDFAEAKATLGLALALEGRADEAQVFYEEALGNPGASLIAIQAALMNLNYICGMPPREIARRHQAALTRPRFVAEDFSCVPHNNTKDRGRRLRIGYVSGDFRRHSVSYFFEPVVEHHRLSGSIEVWCYSTAPEEDDVTLRIRAQAHHWSRCQDLDDDALAQRIRGDGIDVLVDLAGHTAGSRPGVFTRKPAPISITWLGYPTSVGLPAIDYRLTDGVVDPAGIASHGPEALLRMPHSYYCYRPCEEAATLSPKARASDRPVVFGSFNALSKLNGTVLRLWARVLELAPDARHLIKSKGLDDPGATAQLHARLSAAGIPSERVDLRGWDTDLHRHFAAYCEADVALDTSPYNGATTTCEALWMGVPVVTLCGDTHAGRMGASLLHAAGLDELIAGNPDEYALLAAGLARDRPRLAELQIGLRTRLSASPLMDELAFTAALEERYRSAWHAWCEGRAGFQAARTES